MFRELPPQLDLEAGVLELWKREDTFAESLRLSEGRPPFVFYEGPPTANGIPHNGHVLTRVIKDLFPRYRSMRGYHVERKAGWDTHGLPVEVEVEKSLGIHGKAAIEDYGLEAFAQKCIDSVFVYTREWEELTERLGFWVDLEQAYVTYHRSYVESVWWALSELFKKGLLYQGHKVVWWWPQGGTALSAAEVGLGYKEVDDPSVTVRFRVEGEESLFLLAWTTTPWTLPSNTAIAVHPDLDYATVQHGEEQLIVAAALADQVPGEVIKTVKGAELLGLRYRPLFDFARPEEGDAWRVIPGKHVTLDAGTGLVHTAPAFGEEDFAVAKEQGIGMLQMIGPDGCFLPGTGDLEGLFCKDADKVIIRKLKASGDLFKQDTVRHDYPFCWRADKDPLIQYARPAWFIRTTSKKEEAMANSEEVFWLPDHIRSGRFGDFLRNNVDWALSRERFWGTPLNIWHCSECDVTEAPASTAEILERNPDAFDPSVSPDLQIHRPWIDKVTFPCAACGGAMERVPEVIDCWFDSGCMPFAQWGFPHQGQDEFRRSFPADFISEAVDQTRGWFYSLLMINTLLFDEETCERNQLTPPGLPRPYKTCIVLGHVGDMDGKKESKSKGNYTSPDLVLRGEMRVPAIADPSLKPGEMGMKRAQLKSLELSSKDRFLALEGEKELPLKPVQAAIKSRDGLHFNPEDLQQLGIEEGGWIRLKAPFAAPGADAFRWLFYASNPPWSNTRLSIRAIRELQREFLMRLRNVHSFFTIYANISGFDPQQGAPRLAEERHVMDRWILSELKSTRDQVTRDMDQYSLFEAAHAIQDFVEALANWYVRRSRQRFWGSGADAEDGLWTLYEVLTQLSYLIAPFVPFTAEALYQDLVRGPVSDAADSIHHCLWPELEEVSDDASLREAMGLLRGLASLGRENREKASIRVRQPLAHMDIVLADRSMRERLQPLLPLLAEELNVKSISWCEQPERYVSFAVRPNYRLLGKRLGKSMKACAQALAALGPEAIMEAQRLGSLSIDLDGQPVTLSGEEIEFRVQPLEGYQASGSEHAVVILHTELSPALLREGMAREILSRLQSQRKNLGLSYTQRVAVALRGDSELMEALEEHRAWLAGEALVSSWLEDSPQEQALELEVDGRKLSLWMQAQGEPSA